jgi:hypothetical protein
MASRLLLATALVALAAGCGDHTSNHASRPGSSGDRIVLKVEPMSLPRELPRRACFVGIRSYDVMLFGVRLPQRHSCARVAREVFPHAAQLPWSREEYRSSDQVEECELARDGGRLQVLRGDPDQEGPRFDAAYDLSRRACGRLEREGWKVIFQER